MLPIQNDFPEFVPDQLLTSEHLNLLFGYLEEQGRLTRTNLIGIGIVCGLEIKINSDATALTITKGCGITSEGYLIAVPEITYTSCKAFDPVQERIYSLFVDSSKNKRFNIDELKQAAVEEGTTSLSKEYLSDKVVLLFVEILEEGAKNCNPNSCDDKGINVTVSFKPLLVSKADAESLKAGASTETSVSVSLPQLKMPRFDVTATPLASSAAVFEAYRKILNATFLAKAEEVLGKAFTALSPILIDVYTSNPFAGLAANFKFLHDASINESQLLNLQYYYDLFSDAFQAYEELRRSSITAIGICCPDSNLFPRHLLLGLAIGDKSSSAQYRHHFIPSPILSGNARCVKGLRMLFQKLVLLFQQFEVPVPLIGKARELRKANRLDENIKITPDKFGDVAHSKKSIPYYYKVANGEPKLFESWCPDKTAEGTADTILSYHAGKYNTEDEEVLKPLLFELEPYNFLRIEGHIGKPYQHSLRNIISIKDKFRLPFSVVALSADVKAIIRQARELNAGRITGATSDEEFKCQFEGLEALYDTIAAELTCMLCKEMKYFYNLPGEDRTLATPASTIPQVTLLQKCGPAFRFKPGSFGHEFEIYFNKIKNQAYISADFFLSSSPSLAASRQNIGWALLYYIEKLSETVTADLNSFNLLAFTVRYKDLLRVAEAIKQMLQNAESSTDNFKYAEDVLDHVDALIYACKQAKLTSLYKEYVQRWLEVLMLQRLAYFVRKHPGIQHKGGVTIGGTFILVYHEKNDESPNERESITNVDTIRAFADFRSGPAFSLAGEELERESSKASLSKTATAEGRSLNTVLKELISSATRVENEVDELITDISDGTVIADFYLPYLCYSDCPPINFILKEAEPAEEQVNIEIRQKEYCITDSNSYPVELSPAGGSATGEGLTDTSGNVTFKPSSVSLAATEKQKTVTLSYSKSGQSDTVDVIVYQKPVAAFNVQPGTAAPRQFLFSNKSEFASTFEWDFGDGTVSSNENPNHVFATDGTFVVKLTVKNVVCTSSTEQRVNVQVPVTKTCLPLEGIVKQFRELSSIDEPRFEPFKNIFQRYADAEELFKEMEVLVSESIDKQIDFFASKSIPSFLNRCLTELMRLATGSDVQLLAMALYRILVSLALYIACIQGEDIDKAKVNLEKIFALIVSHLKALEPAIPNLPPEVKEQLKALLAELEAESQRVKANQEEAKKPLYLKLIEEAIAIIKSFNL